MLSKGYLTFNEDCIKVQNMKMLSGKTVKPRGKLQILPKSEFQKHTKFRAIVNLYKTK